MYAIRSYYVTAKAKGLSKRQVLWRHAVRNAMIPIITVIGLQFGGMLGGSAVTEKVFNISGIGSYIVDKQFIPDIPSIMGGVVYTAITISLIVITSYSIHYTKLYDSIDLFEHALIL